VLLSLGQWAIDGHAHPKSSTEVLQRLDVVLDRFVAGLREYTDAVRVHGQPSRVQSRRSLFQGDARRLASGRMTNRFVGRASLLLTSPPYPGVHVLYHRWQVRGRAETALPFWLAGLEDGAGGSHYTMGGRSEIGIEHYFVSMADAWFAVKRLLRPGALVVQMLALPTPEAQLPRYLQMMESAGYVRREDLEPDAERTVPNRRWYNRVSPDRGQSREFVLIHENPRGMSARAK
jgi:hypothetical protein